MKTVSGYQTPVPPNLVCVAGALCVIVQHRIPASPGHVSVALMRNAKEHFVYQESAKVDLFLNELEKCS